MSDEPALVVPSRKMKRREYKKHLKMRHVRRTMGREEHDELHSLFPEDYYDHQHQE